MLGAGAAGVLAPTGFARAQSVNSTLGLDSLRAGGGGVGGGAAPATWKLLCHFDGTNGQTTFTDSSSYAHPLTPTTVQVSTTSPKFGTGRGDFTTGGTGSNISAGTPADFNFGAGQFTVDAWCWFVSAPGGTIAIVSQFALSANLGWFFGFNSGSLSLYYSTTGTDLPFIGAGFSPTLLTWYHLACDRDGSNMVRIYVNGAVLTSATLAATIFPSTLTCMIGNDHTTTRGFNGYLDEARVVVGQAMYGGAFTPPSAAYPY